MIKRYKKLFLAVAAIAAFMVSPIATIVANAAPAPCNPAGAGKYACTFWTTTPLEGPSNGTLATGTNWVTCQQAGRSVTVSGWTNHWWAWTLRDRGTGSYGNGWGWVNAVYAKGGNNNEGFRGVPNCNGAHGATPQAPTQNPQASNTNKPAVPQAAAPTPAAKTTKPNTSPKPSAAPAAASQSSATGTDSQGLAPGKFTAACPPKRTCYYPTGNEFLTGVPEGAGFNCGMDRIFMVGGGKHRYAVCRDNAQMARKLLQNDRY